MYRIAISWAVLLANFFELTKGRIGSLIKKITVCTIRISLSFQYID